MARARSGSLRKLPHGRERNFPAAGGDPRLFAVGDVIALLVAKKESQPVV